MSRYLKPSEAAEKMAVTERTLEYLRSKGNGPPVTRIGKLVRYSETELDKWLVDHTEERDEES